MSYGNPRLTIRFSREQMARIEMLARIAGVTESEIVRGACGQLFEGIAVPIITRKPSKRVRKLKAA